MFKVDHVLSKIAKNVKFIFSSTFPSLKCSQILLNKAGYAATSCGHLDLVSMNIETSPIRQRCVLIVSLRVLTLALNLDGQTDEDIVSNEAHKIS